MKICNGGIEFPNQAMFNPRKYLKGLVQSIIKNGGEIYENTTANSIKKDMSGYKIYTNKGNVLAKYIVVATHYPIINFPGFYFIKMYQEASYAIAIETKDKLFQGMYIKAEEPILSFRTAKDRDKNIVIIGGMNHRVGAKIDLSDAYSALEKIAKEMFSDAEVLYRWNTQDCITLDKVPYIGEFSKIMENVYVSTGYKKWGMTTSNVAAKIIADKIQGRHNKYEEIFTSTRLQPIKNRWEFGEMLKETTNSLMLNKLKVPKEKLDDVNIGEGKIVQVNNEKVRCI